MAKIAFFIMFGAVVIYVVLGNYLYFAKVLPALDESPKLFPSGQLKDVKRYLELLDEQGERPWFGAILRNAMPINVIYLIGMATTFVLMFLDS
jgi:hypothetical protein